MTVGTVVGVGREQFQALAVFALDLIDDAELGVDEGRKLGEQQASDRSQVALADPVADLGPADPGPVPDGDPPVA